MPRSGIPSFFLRLISEFLTGLVRASKENEQGPQNASQLRYEMQLRSARQAAEWGMRQLQGGFPRLKARFPFEERGHRRVVMRMITSLNNYRARTVGIAQILTVYMPQLKKQAKRLFPDLSQ